MILMRMSGNSRVMCNIWFYFNLSFVVMGLFYIMSLIYFDFVLFSGGAQLSSTFVCFK